MTKPRVPPIWLVLLPALVLAAVGARAVTAEMRASRDAARDRARSIASRLARSVDALVAEYAGPLPAEGSSVTKNEAQRATEHLVAIRALTTDGVSLLLDRRAAPDPGEVPADEAVLAEDAIQRARRLAREPNGVVAAAALTAAASHAVSHPVAAARLLQASAEYELAIPGVNVEQVRRGNAVMDSPRWLDDAIERGAYLRDADGAAFDLRALSLATAAAKLGGGDVVEKPYRRVAEDPWGLPAAVRDRALDEAEATLGNGGARCVNVRTGWDAARRLARELTDRAAPPRATVIVLPLVHGDVRPEVVLAVWTSVVLDGRRALLGGNVPGRTVDERIDGEAAALVGEPEVASVRLVKFSGEHAFDHWAGQGPVAASADFAVEAVALGSSLPGWSVQVAALPSSDVPATAWLLAAAVAATTLALLFGALALRRSAERSARLAEDRRTFLDHVAHELRTPAAAVQALTEELASGHVAPERERVYREHLLRESRRLSALVDETLDLARLDAGRLAFKMEPADLRDVVREGIEASADAGRVVAKLPDAPIVRDVDAAALRRAVKNLVENAVRHGGGDRPVTVTLEASNGAAFIAVRDEGRGIAKEHLPRLFERFFRVPSATHETKGVGLGLALVREVARAHGGEVEVESEVGKGSTFTLRLPT